MTLTVFSLVLMSRTILTPPLLMILTLLTIGFICGAFFLLPRASTSSAAFFRITISLTFYAGMAWKSAATMQASESGYHFRNLSFPERLTYLSEK
jgi:hypothetical protein